MGQDTITKSGKKAGKPAGKRPARKKQPDAVQPGKVAYAPGEKTLVTLLLDRSGSMERLHEQTVTAINAYLAELRASPADIRFSLVLFDSVGANELCLIKKYVAVPVADVPDLAFQDFEPRGSTPLIDAAFEVITAVADSLKDKEARVVVAIQTDGDENSSTRHSWSDLKELIAAKQAGGWEFVFMGAGINAFDQGARMGIAAANTLSYGNNREETVAAFRATAANTGLYAAGMAASMSYSQVQRQGAGERHAPGAGGGTVGGGIIGGFPDADESDPLDGFSMAPSGWGLPNALPMGIPATGPLTAGDAIGAYLPGTGPNAGAVAPTGRGPRRGAGSWNDLVKTSAK